MRDPMTVYNGSNILASGSTASGDTIWWDLQNIQPFQPVNVFTYLLMPGPQNVINTRARFEAWDANQQVQSSTNKSCQETVLCSFDPNDKACTPEGDGIDHYTLIGDELEYRIRFQNTGNDTAYDVRIYDRLDTALDRSSFEVVRSSHNVQTTLDSTGQVTFYFQNIFLPDSNVDEPGSNGYVTYRIRPKSGTPDFTRVENTAYIVFDLNPAIITNTTFNTLVTQLPLWMNPNNTFNNLSVYPNPFNKSTAILVPEGPGARHLFELTDLTGRVLRSEQFQGELLVVDRQALPPGIYLYRISSLSDSGWHAGKLIIE
jgi:uncharacterized repeat protein (TIGR01451 family)